MTGTCQNVQRLYVIPSQGQMTYSGATYIDDNGVEQDGFPPIDLRNVNLACLNCQVIVPQAPVGNGDYQVQQGRVNVLIYGITPDLDGAGNQLQTGRLTYYSLTFSGKYQSGDFYTQMLPLNQWGWVVPKVGPGQ